MLSTVYKGFYQNSLCLWSPTLQQMKREFSRNHIMERQLCIWIESQGLSALALQSGSNPDRSRFDPVRTRHAKIITGSNPDSLDPHTGGSFNWIQLDRSGIIVGAVSCHGTASVYARICCVFLGTQWRLAGVLTKSRLYWESGALLMSKVSWMG